MLLSIIVPVYNTKNVLSRCLDSILMQRIAEMEIICVDDGSTDGSGELLDQYAESDSRIRVIHKPHGGLVQARKSGIREATGEYTGYVDSDDWIEPEMYDTLCSIAVQCGADMVSSGYVLEKGTQVAFFDGFAEGFYEKEKLELLRGQIFFREETREAGIRPSLCTKLFRTSLLKKVQQTIPDEISNCEDRLCTVRYMLEAESVYIVHSAFYHYLFHIDSMSRREDIYYLDKIGKVYRTLRSMYSHPAFSEKLRVQCELYITKMVLTGLNECMGFSVWDLLWLHPEWIDMFPEKSKIVLYGAGRLGKACYRQIISDNTKNLQLTAWVDRNYQNLTGYSQQIKPPEYIAEADYDYVLIALTDGQSAGKVREYLMCELAVKQEKIVWIKQQDIFWKYAEAVGLLRR